MDRIEAAGNIEKELEYFKMHPDFEKDLIGLDLFSSPDPRFLTELKTCLFLLRTLGYRAHVELKSKFEKLKYAPGLYSMRIRTSAKNIRIIYSIQRDGTILLCGFYERAGKRKTDYTTPIKTAQSRLKELTGGD